jgi:hypothetical protein
MGVASVDGQQRKSSSPVISGTLRGSGTMKRCVKALPADALCVNAKLAREVYESLYALCRIYQVRPGVIVERGIRLMTQKARREGFYDNALMTLTRWNGRQTCGSGCAFFLRGYSSSGDRIVWALWPISTRLLHVSVDPTGESQCRESQTHGRL